VPFSFLNPWFWVGALAVAAPLWLHLRRKKQTNLIRFSALQFLDDQPEPRRSPLRLRNIVLLALRLLAVVLIIAAFAWPYLRVGDAVPIKESRVYILDNTLSHQAMDGFKRDRNRIVSDLAKAGSGIQVAVIELTAAPRVVVQFGDDRKSGSQKMQALEPSFQRGPYMAAFRQASLLLANCLGHEKRIVFLGDNQQNQWSENVSTPPFLRNIEIELPKGLAPVLPNLSLSEPRAQRIFLGEKSLVNFTVKLSHAGEARDANVILRANGQVIFNRSINLEQQPQTMLVHAEWEVDPGAWLRGEAVVEGSPDALAADNHVYFSLAPVVEGTVALLAQSSYLRLALSPEIMRGEWASRLIEPARLSAELAAERDADVLCLESNYLQSSDARKLMWHYLTNGRGVVLIVNRVTPSIKGYLHELGFEAEERPERPGTPFRAEKFQFVSFNHPIFHPFLSADYGNLMEITVSRYSSLKSSQAMPLIFSEKGAGLFFQSTKFSGKLFVTAFGLDREDVSWPIHQSFIPFLDLTLQAARAEDPTPTAFEPGEIATIQLAGPAVGAREVVLKGERGESSRTPVESGRAQVRMPDNSGLYTVTYDESSKIEKVFAVNVPPKESELMFVNSPEALKLWQVNTPITAKKSRVLASQISPGLRGILQQHLWWWMVVGGLLALLLEMAMALGRREHG
jgi:hypothetical protein